MVVLRDYQQELEDGTFEAWRSGDKNVLAVLPTGGGKTVFFSDIIHKEGGSVCAIAHRKELVSQISISLGRAGVRHRIVAPQKTIRDIISLQVTKLGASFYDPGARVAVAGVDTLVRRRDELGAWLASVSLWVQDEAHHVTASNKWGEAASMFPNARGLGVTATPLRADGKGLGRHADGLFDSMIIGPTMRTLINRAYLTDYKIYAPPSDLDLGGVNISAATGDFNATKLRTAVKSSQITGDVVSHYLKYAAGKLGVTFATDVEGATEIAQKFNEAGVAAAVVSAKTDDRLRADLLRRFENREIMQLVNVDLFGEGFDLPAIEVVSMARPTQSYGLYVQQFGRALRLLEGKRWAIIIDHVGNVVRHGLPDAPREWTLDRRERRSKGAPADVIPVKACPECSAVYERTHKACPFCGYYAPPAARSGPEYVDGDLTEMAPETLAKMRGEIETFDRSPESYREELAAKHVPPIGQMANVKRFKRGQEAQQVLRDSIALWAGYQQRDGVADSVSYREFYFKFGVDVLGAQTLKLAEATALNEKVRSAINAKC